jgi:UDP-GlcNAc:undecaprenyl-phosphate GlcNAc-1-phosphate transferase
MNELWPYVVTILAAWLGTDLLIPWVTRFAFAMGKVDNPGGRKVHTTPIPRLGGIAIYLGFVLALALLEFLKPGIFFATRGPWIGVVAGATVVFALGILDDLLTLPAKLKLVIQIGAAFVAYKLGVRIEVVTNPFGGMIVLPYAVSMGVTIFWLVGITNTINLIDGLDGLAGGVTAIAAITLGILALQTDQVFSALIALTLAGATIGFLRYNFNPAKIFMGDSGSLFMGFTLGALAITGVLKTAAAVTLVLPILILGVPIFDTTFAILRRSFNGRPIFEPDKGHLHHRLLGAGLSQRRAVLLIYGMSALLGGFALHLAGARWAIPIIVLSGLFFAWSLRDMAQRARDQQKSDAA